MSPAFNSWAAFFAMGGYAFYVWLAAGATLIALAGLIGHTLWRRRVVLAAVRRQQTRQRRRQGGSPLELSGPTHAVSQEKIR